MSKRRHLAVTGKMRRWAEHYAVNNDALEAVRYAFPQAAEWDEKLLPALANKMRRNPAVMAVVLEVRAPVVKRLQVDYGWKLRESVRVYTYALTHGDVKGAISALRLIDDMTAGDLVPADRPPADRRYAPSEIEDGELVDIAEHVFPRALTQGDDSPAPFGSAALPQQFCELLRRAPAGDASPGVVYSVADGGTGPDQPSDGVHAAGSGEVDVLQRLRAKLGARESARDKPDLSEPHPGAE